MLSPACIRSKPLLISSSVNTWVIIGSISILPVNYQSTILGTSVRPLGAAERGPAPVAPGDQLERPRGDFLARLRDADDDARPPAAMAAFERLPHDLGIAGAIEAVIRAAIENLDDVRHDIGLCFGLTKSVMPKLAAPLLLGRIDVDPDDAVGAGHARALDDVEPDPAEPEHHDIVAGLDLGGIDHRADPGGHPAADVTGLVERRVGSIFATAISGSTVKFEKVEQPM